MVHSIANTLCVALRYLQHIYFLLGKRDGFEGLSFKFLFSWRRKGRVGHAVLQRGALRGSKSWVVFVKLRVSYWRVVCSTIKRTIFPYHPHIEKYIYAL